MKFTVHGSRFTACTNENTVNCQLSTVNCRRRRQGFGLIEFMIVITVFGIATAVITASFLTFERNQRLKSAASMLKNDIRLVQNKALAGDKGVGGTCNVDVVANPNANPTLLGWYLQISSPDSEHYKISWNCRISGAEAIFDQKTVSLPRGVLFANNGVICGVYTGNSGTIFYQPLVYSASFHDELSPPFFNAGNLIHTLPCTNSDLVITLQASGVANSYQVIVKPSGEVNEQK